MTGKRGRPTKKEALEKAWQTIRAAGGEGVSEFDARAVLVSIATDPDVAPTARCTAIRMLAEMDRSARNAQALTDAGL